LTGIKLEERPEAKAPGMKGMNMSEISVIGNPAAGAARQMSPTTAPVEVVAPEATTGTAASNGVEATITTDSVEFSQHAQLLEKIHQLPEVRQDKIDAIKDSIANDAYLTNDKLDIAVNRMIDELMG
jgi:anti-sigma28 factor (negative regulator of flagellin synthesis)